MPGQMTCAMECGFEPCPTLHVLSLVCDRSDGMLRTLHLVGMPAVSTAFATKLAAHHSHRCG